MTASFELYTAPYNFVTECYQKNGLCLALSVLLVVLGGTKIALHIEIGEEAEGEEEKEERRRRRRGGGGGGKEEEERRRRKGGGGRGE